MKWKTCFTFQFYVYIHQSCPAKDDHMTNDIEELQSEKDYLRYAMGNISSNGVVSTSNKLLRPIELSSNEYKALLY